MSRENRQAGKIREKMKKLAKDFEEKKSDPSNFLKKMDELTREYYRAKHPELAG